MSILPGMRDFNRGHAAHKPYTLKDRGGMSKQETVCVCVCVCVRACVHACVIYKN